MWGAGWPVLVAGRAEIVYSDRGSLFLVNADGSCFACSGARYEMNGGVNGLPAAVGPPSFRADGSVGFVPADRFGRPDGSVASVGVDGLRYAEVPVGLALQPVWSSTGRFAFVRRVDRREEVLAAGPGRGRVRQLTEGGASSPSWSPDGRSLAVVASGWVELIDLSGRVQRRLAPGRAPAWSPDGRWVALIGARDRVLMVSAGGGAPRVLAGVRGVRVDWQPIPTRRTHACVAPRGSRVLISTPATIVTERAQSDPNSGAGSSSWMACARAEGRARQVATGVDYGNGTSRTADEFVAAGRFVAFETLASVRQGNPDIVIETFDLASGRIVSTDFAGNGPDNPRVIVSPLLLSPLGFTAWLETTDVESPRGTWAAILAHDARGTSTLDTETTTIPPPTSNAGLASLQIVGDEVRWTHDGQPQSATFRH